MAENKWVSLELFHPYKWSYNWFFSGPTYSCRWEKQKFFWRFFFCDTFDTVWESEASGIKVQGAPKNRWFSQPPKWMVKIMVPKTLWTNWWFGGFSHYFWKHPYSHIVSLNFIWEMDINLGTVWCLYKITWLFIYIYIVLTSMGIIK